MSIQKLTDTARYCIESLASCRKVDVSRIQNLGLETILDHLMSKCETACTKYFSCNNIALANDILLGLEEERK